MKIQVLSKFHEITTETKERSTMIRYRHIEIHIHTTTTTRGRKGKVGIFIIVRARDTRCALWDPPFPQLGVLFPLSLSLSLIHDPCTMVKI